jgi:hypothetical protein
MESKERIIRPNKKLDIFDNGFLIVKRLHDNHQIIGITISDIINYNNQRYKIFSINRNFQKCEYYGYRNITNMISIVLILIDKAKR